MVVLYFMLVSEKPRRKWHFSSNPKEKMYVKKAEKKLAAAFACRRHRRHSWDDSRGNTRSNSEPNRLSWLTEHFKVSDPENPPIDEFRVVQKSRLANIGRDSVSVNSSVGFLLAASSSLFFFPERDRPRILGSIVRPIFFLHLGQSTNNNDVTTNGD